MKHLSFLRRHANIVFCLLLCLVYQRAESKELFENNSLDTCYVLAIANVDLTTDLQKKYEERNIATSAIVGYSFSDDEVKIYLLDDRYDFDLYSIQKGDSITLHYPHTSQEKEKKAIAIHNHSFQERIRKNDSIYIDIDFWNIEKKLSLPPSLDDGLFLKWEIAKRRFIKHIVKDSQGFHKLDVENEDDLRLSKRTFGQLYCMYILVEKAREFDPFGHAGLTPLGIYAVFPERHAALCGESEKKMTLLSVTCLLCVRMRTLIMWGGISTNVLKAKDSLVKRQPDCWIIFSGRRAHGVSMDLWKMTISAPNAYANVLVCAAKDVSKSL